MINVATITTLNGPQEFRGYHDLKIKDHVLTMTWKTATQDLHYVRTTHYTTDKQHTIPLWRVLEVVETSEPG